MTSMISTRFIAALAVFAMAFAGFGALAIEDVDAADAPKIVWSLENTEDGIAVVYEKEGYVAIKDIKDLIGSDKFSATYSGTFGFATDKTVADISQRYADAFGDKVFAIDAKELGGALLALSTVIGVKEVDEAEGNSGLYNYKEDGTVDGKDVFYNLTVDKTTVEFLVAEGEFAYTDEELLDIEAAVAALFADYSSPEMVKKAVDDAIAQYIADHPAKTDDTTLWMCVAAVFGIASAALGIFLVVALVKAKKEGRRFI